MNEQDDIKAVVMGELGRTITIPELCRAFTDNGKKPNGISEATYHERRKTGELTHPSALHEVSEYFSIDYARLLRRYGYLDEGDSLTEEPARGAVTQVTRSAKKEKTRREPNLRGFGL